MAKRHFRFAARVLEHLGAELISSDDVAIYELAKNGFDAAVDRSKPSQVVVDVNYAAPAELIRGVRSSLLARYGKSQHQLSRDQVLEPLAPRVPDGGQAAAGGESIGGRGRGRRRRGAADGGRGIS